MFCKFIMKKVEIIYSDIKGCSNVDDENFRVLKGWLSRFVERNNLCLRK